MITRFLIFAFCLFVFNLTAQEETPQTNMPQDPMREQTLFKNARVSGGFGGPIFTYSNTNGQDMWGAGGGGGVVIDGFFVGVFGMGESFEQPTFTSPVYEERVALGYGGLWMGYSWPTLEVIHLYTSVKIAGGAVGSYYHDQDYEYWDYTGFDDPVFVGIPEVGVELNVARWFRLGATAGYRYVGGFEGWKDLNSGDLSAFQYGLTLRFGWFSRR